MAVIKKNPMLIAIEILGGVEGLMELWGLPERRVRKMLKQDPGEWMAMHTAAIADATHYSVLDLVTRGGSVEDLEADVKPRLRRAAA